MCEAIQCSIARDHITLWIGQQCKGQVQCFLCLQVDNHSIGCNSENSTIFLAKVSILLCKCAKQSSCLASCRTAWKEQHKVLTLLVIPGTMWHAISAGKGKNWNELPWFELWVVLLICV